MNSLERRLARPWLGVLVGLTLVALPGLALAFQPGSPPYSVNRVPTRQHLPSGPAAPTA